jgi:hypothetical protein
MTWLNSEKHVNNISGPFFEELTNKKQLRFFFQQSNASAHRIFSIGSTGLFRRPDIHGRHVCQIKTRFLFVGKLET